MWGYKLDAWNLRHVVLFNLSIQFMLVEVKVINLKIFFFLQKLRYICSPSLNKVCKEKKNKDRKQINLKLKREFKSYIIFGPI